MKDLKLVQNDLKEIFAKLDNLYANAYDYCINGIDYPISVGGRLALVLDGQRYVLKFQHELDATVLEIMRLTSVISNELMEQASKEGYKTIVQASYENAVK